MKIRPVSVIGAVVLLLLSGNGALSSKLPTVLIASLVRNKAHTLPYFFSSLDQLDYPKDRISFWIRSDHNEDNSEEIIETWVSWAQPQYHSIHWTKGGDESPAGEQNHRRMNESSIFHWPEERFRDVMLMKEEALGFARDMWADYVFLLDADAFLTHPESLQLLIRQNVTVVAPMLQSDGLYSNYWCGMTKEFYYERTDEYKTILDGTKVGTFPVPMIHSALFIHLNDKQSDYLTYDPAELTEYAGPIDDIIVFAMSANYSHTSLYVTNVVDFGYILPPLEPDDVMEKDWQQLTNIQVLFINEFARPLFVIDELKRFLPAVPKDRVSLSRIYMINLWRREERRKKMNLNFEALGLDVVHFPAVDGKLMDEEYLKEMNIQFLPGFLDPYSKRPMTMGEIGCFLSHYFIWERIVEEGLPEVLILEDDIRFEPFFKQRLYIILNEVRATGGWDLLYLGRKRLHESDEPWVEGTNYLVRPSYSYWTLGYLISQAGARKLLATNPLQKLVPVDEYLPIMFDTHTNEEWKKKFPDRNLNAFSVSPLILFPTHYTGDKGYISDTEDSVPIPIEAATGNGSSVEGKAGGGGSEAAKPKTNNINDQMPSAIETEVEQQQQQPTGTTTMEMNQEHHRVKHEL